MTGLLRGFPLLVLPAALYAALAYSMGDAAFRLYLAGAAFSLVLPSGAEWIATRGNALTIFAAFCLFIEIIKSTRPVGGAIVENALVFLAFSGSLVLFLLEAEFGTMEYFLIMSMMLVDFMAGAIVMIYVARRDVSFTH
jgi:hypothetical protein